MEQIAYRGYQIFSNNDVVLITYCDSLIPFNRIDGLSLIDSAKAHIDQFILLSDEIRIPIDSCVEVPGEA